MLEIRLKQEAYACGGLLREGLFVLTEWYEALAEDAEGNEYIVIWKISNPDIEDESAVCNWYEPWAIYDENGNDVSDTVTLEKMEDENE